MSIENTLYDALRNDTAVSAIVGSKIYPQVAPDTIDSPYIVYQVISGNAYNKLAGAPDVEKKYIQINCLSKSYSQAKSLAVATKAAMNVDIGYLSSESDDYFTATETHRVRLDFALIG